MMECDFQDQVIKDIVMSTLLPLESLTQGVARILYSRHSSSLWKDPYRGKQSLKESLTELGKNMDYSGKSKGEGEVTIWVFSSMRKRMASHENGRPREKTVSKRKRLEFGFWVSGMSAVVGTLEGY